MCSIAINDHILTQSTQGCINCPLCGSMELTHMIHLHLGLELKKVEGLENTNYALACVVHLTIPFTFLCVIFPCFDSHFHCPLCLLNGIPQDLIECSNFHAIKAHFEKQHGQPLSEGHWSLVKDLIWSEVITLPSQWEGCLKSVICTFTPQFWGQGYANDMAVNTDDLCTSLLLYLQIQTDIPLALLTDFYQDNQPLGFGDGEDDESDINEPTRDLSYHPQQLPQEVIAMDITDSHVSSLVPEFVVDQTSEAVPAPNPLQNLYPQELVQAGLCLAPSPYAEPATNTFLLVCISCQVALNLAFIPMSHHFQCNVHWERTLRPLAAIIPTALDAEDLDASKDEDISEIGDEEMDLVTGEEVDGEFGVGGSRKTTEMHPLRAQGRTASLKLVLEYLQAAMFTVHLPDKNAETPPNPVPAITKLQVWRCYQCSDCKMYSPAHVKIVTHANKEKHTAPLMMLHLTQKLTHLHPFFPVTLAPTSPPAPVNALKEQLKAASAANAPPETVLTYDNDPWAIAPFLHQFRAISIHGGKDPLKYL